MIHVYYGDGKGKTTAAAGLALRALGNGMPVVFLQFLKARQSGEITVFSGLSGITVLRNAIDYGFYKNMSEEKKKQVTQNHNQNLQQVFGLYKEGKCGMLVLDEVFAAYQYGVLDRDIVKQLLLMAEEKKFELILTGRNPDIVFIGKADYITQMKKERHPFDLGVSARKRIEY